jgi:hypothetical protein
MALTGGNSARATYSGGQGHSTAALTRH